MGMLFCIGLFLPCMLPCNLLLGFEGGGEGEGGEQRQCRQEMGHPQGQ